MLNVLEDLACNELEKLVELLIDIVKNLDGIIKLDTGEKDINQFVQDIHVDGGAKKKQILDKLFAEGSLPRDIAETAADMVSGVGKVVFLSSGLADQVKEHASGAIFAWNVVKAGAQKIADCVEKSGITEYLPRPAIVLELANKVRETVSNIAESVKSLFQAPMETFKSFKSAFSSLREKFTEKRLSSQGVLSVQLYGVVTSDSYIYRPDDSEYARTKALSFLSLFKTGGTEPTTEEQTVDDTNPLLHRWNSVSERSYKL